MTQQLTPHEQDALSAYLDNALNPRERQRLETQLQSRPEMRAALNDLRQTRLLLQQTPILRVPRNFTLSPEMAGLRTRPPRVYPVFQWAFTLASLFFILVFAGELFSGSPVTMAPAPESFSLEEAPAQAMDSLPVGDNGYDQRNTGEAAGDTATEDGGVGSAEVVPPSEGTPTPDMSFAMVETFTPTPEPTYKSAPETEAVEEGIPVVEGPMTMTVLMNPENDLSVEQTAPVPQPDFWASRWRVPQVVLGVLVVISGVGLFFFRRKTML